MPETVHTGIFSRLRKKSDLLFARKPRKKQIPHPVQKPNGVRNDIFLSFSAGCSGEMSAYPVVRVIRRGKCGEGR
jgi:hypothetical protein